MTDKAPFEEILPEPQLILALAQGRSPYDQENLALHPPQLKNLVTKCWITQTNQRPTAIDCLRAVQYALIFLAPKSITQAGIEKLNRERLSSIVTGCAAQQHHPLRGQTPTPSSVTQAAQALQALPQRNQDHHPGPYILSMGFHAFFTRAFSNWLKQRQLPLDLPRVDGKMVELPNFFLVVGALGGWRTVSQRMLWQVVGADLGLPLFMGPTLSLKQEAAEQLSKIYEKVLAEFEADWHRSLKPCDPNSGFPLPRELQHLRPQIERLAIALILRQQEVEQPPRPLVAGSQQALGGNTREPSLNQTPLQSPQMVQTQTRLIHIRNSVLPPSQQRYSPQPLVSSVPDPSQYVKAPQLCPPHPQAQQLPHPNTSNGPQGPSPSNRGLDVPRQIGRRNYPDRPGGPQIALGAQRSSLEAGMPNGQVAHHPCADSVVGSITQAQQTMKQPVQRIMKRPRSPSIQMFTSTYESFPPDRKRLRKDGQNGSTSTTMPSLNPGAPSRYSQMQVRGPQQAGPQRFTMPTPISLLAGPRPAGLPIPVKSGPWNLGLHKHAVNSGPRGPQPKVHPSPSIVNIWATPATTRNVDVGATIFNSTISPSSSAIPASLANNLSQLTASISASGRRFSANSHSAAAVNAGARSHTEGEIHFGEELAASLFEQREMDDGLSGVDDLCETDSDTDSDLLFFFQDSFNDGDSATAAAGGST
ncbi:hypothetical protein FRC00_002770 [Tulasnella sp. 408]|nr:hypothetical protein FRC00_002770 [Tulasnella sp. 408]